MKVLDPGHRYELDDLKTDTKTILQFSKDPRLHDGDGYPGPSCQEVLRVIIDRVQTLNNEKHWPGNKEIIFHARMMIAGFEARAIIRRVEKGELPIELLPLAPDGHIQLPDPI